MKRPDVVEWGGNPRNTQGMASFLRSGDRPGSRVIWWLEPDLMGSCDLLVTRETSTGSPLRVRAGDLLRLRDGEFSINGNRRDRKPRSARRASEGS